MQSNAVRQHQGIAIFHDFIRHLPTSEIYGSTGQRIYIWVLMEVLKHMRIYLKCEADRLTAF